MGVVLGLIVTMEEYVGLVLLYAVFRILSFFVCSFVHHPHEGFFSTSIFRYPSQNRVIISWPSKFGISVEESHPRRKLSALLLMSQHRYCKVLLRCQSVGWNV